MELVGREDHFAVWHTFVVGEYFVDLFGGVSIRSKRGIVLLLGHGNVVHVRYDGIRRTAYSEGK